MEQHWTKRHQIKLDKTEPIVTDTEPFLLP